MWTGESRLSAQCSPACVRFHIAYSQMLFPIRNTQCCVPAGLQGDRTLDAHEARPAAPVLQDAEPRARRRLRLQRLRQSGIELRRARLACHQPACLPGVHLLALACGSAHGSTHLNQSPALGECTSAAASSAVRALPATKLQVHTSATCLHWCALSCTNYIVGIYCATQLSCVADTVASPQTMCLPAQV